MIKPVNGRNPYGIELGFYRNLGTRDPAKQWSGRALSGPDKGKKVCEGDSVTLVNCAVFVRLSTRERIAGTQGHREVHAWITGTLIDDGTTVVPATGARRVTYNPYRRADFHYADNGDTFTGAGVVTFDIDGHAYVVG